MNMTAIDRLLEEGQVNEALMTIADLLGGDVSPADRAELELKLAGALDWHLADAERALQHYREALALAEQHGLASRFKAELGVAQTLNTLGRTDEAVPHLERAAALAAEAGDAYGEAAALSVHGDLLQDAGEWEAAEPVLDRAARAAAAAGDLHLQAHVLASLALVVARLERFAAAEEIGLEALSLAKQLGDPGMLATCFLRLGQIQYQQDKLAGASYWFQQGVQTAKKAGLVHLEAIFREALEKSRADN